MDVKSNCCLCEQPLPPRHRKYCGRCSAKASLLWKRQERQGNRGAAYWLDHWLKLTGDLSAARRAYNAYMRSYMRAYRLRRCARRRERNRLKVTGSITGMAFAN